MNSLRQALEESQSELRGLRESYRCLDGLTEKRLKALEEERAHADRLAAALSRQAAGYPWEEFDNDILAAHTARRSTPPSGARRG